MAKLKKWHDIYPQGTKEGDEEFKFFCALSRHPEHHWRNTSVLSKETGLTRERVEEIIDKYYNMGMIFAHPKKDDHWGYWERVPESIPEEKKSICEKDHELRLKNNSRSKS